MRTLQQAHPSISKQKHTHPQLVMKLNEIGVYLVAPQSNDCRPRRAQRTLKRMNLPTHWLYLAAHRQALSLYLRLKVQHRPTLPRLPIPRKPKLRAMNLKWKRQTNREELHNHHHAPQHLTHVRAVNGGRQSAMNPRRVDGCNTESVDPLSSRSPNWGGCRVYR